MAARRAQRFRFLKAPRWQPAVGGRRTAMRLGLTTERKNNRKSAGQIMCVTPEFSGAEKFL